MCNVFFLLHLFPPWVSVHEPFSHRYLSGSPTKQFSYAARNKSTCKYFCLIAIAHELNRTTIKGDWSTIFQTDQLCVVSAKRETVCEKQLCYPPGIQVEKFRDEYKDPVLSVIIYVRIMSQCQPFSNRRLFSACSRWFIPLTGIFWEQALHSSSRDTVTTEMEEIHDSEELKY